MRCNQSFNQVYPPSPEALSKVAAESANCAGSVGLPEKNEKMENAYSMYSNNKRTPLEQGNANSNIQNAPPQTLKNNMPTILLKSQVQTIPADELLSSTLEAIKSNIDKFGLLSTSIFGQIYDSYRSHYYSPAQKSELIRHLIDYMVQCKNRSLLDAKQFTNERFARDFGEQILKRQTEVFFENKNLLRIMSFIGKSDLKYGCYLELSFDLNLDEVIQVARRTRQLYKYDDRAFFFLTNYLLQSCFNLEKKRQPLKQILLSLTQILEKIKEIFPPAPAVESKNNIAIAKEKDIKKDRISYQMIDLTKIEKSGRKQALKRFVIENAKKSQHSESKFVDLIENICRQKGSHFKIGLKVKDQSHQRAIQRVIQKLVDKAFKKFQIQEYQDNQSTDKSLINFLKSENIYYENQMDQIYGNIKEPIFFKVTDMLRGKCLFQTVADIKECAEKLIKKAKSKGYPVVEIDNRLTKNTSDVVFKILIDKTITELQLPIQFNVAHNQFNHKVYEILRSKFYSPLMMLKIINDEIAQDLLKNVSECFSISNKQRTHQEQQAIYDLQHTFQSLEGQLSIFFDMIGYKKNIKQEFIEENLQQRFDQIIAQTANTALPLSQRSKILKNDGIYYQFSRKYEKSVAAYEQYLQVLDDGKQKSKEIECQKYHVNLWLGLSLVDRGNLEKAMSYYQKSIATNPKQDVTQQIDYANTLYNIGNIFILQQNYNQALQNYTKYLNIIEKAKGKNSPELAYALMGIGHVYDQQGKQSSALKYYFKCLNLQERVMGKQSVQCVPVLNNIGVIYQQHGRYSEALETFNRCLQIQHKNDGQESAESTQILNSIGHVYLDQFKLEEAIDYFTKCLQLQERVFGKGSLDTASSLSNIGNVLLRQRKYNESELFFKKCLNILLSFKGKQNMETAMTMNYLGNVYREQGNFEESQIYCRQYLETARKIKGANSIEYASALKQVGIIYKQTGKYNWAVDLFKKCLLIEEKMKGKKSRECAITLNNLALAFEGLKDYKEALDSYARCLNIKEKIHGKQSNQCAHLHHSIGQIYAELKQNDKAAKSYKRSLEIQQKVNGKGMIESAVSLLSLGIVLKEQSKFEEALSHFKSCLELQERLKGKDAIQNAATLTNIAI